VNSFQLPFFFELENASNILIAGASGGFDVFSGLPLYFNLLAAGKKVFLANLTFSVITKTAGREITSALTEITAGSDGSETYFSEKHLCQWFAEQGEQTSVYCFHRVGPKPVTEAYRALVAMYPMYQIDTVILVDGGTDSLMRGDEEGLGTPQEDMTSICAVSQLDLPRKMLVCLGFGIDAFHGVSHAHVLEGIAQLTQAGGYLGAFSLMREMPEVQKFIDATEYVMRKTPKRQSIVCSSIISAIEGHYGDFHRNDRASGSELFINPLMALYWCFRIEEVAQRILYLDGIRNISTYAALDAHIHLFHQKMKRRPYRELPF
jgi:hypothetical protein